MFKVNLENILKDCSFLVSNIYFANIKFYFIFLRDFRSDVQH